MSTDSELIKAHVRHAVYLERYKTSRQKELIRFVKRAYVDYKRALLEVDPKTRAQLNRVIRQIDEISKALKQNTLEFIDNEIEELGAVEAAFAQKSIESSVAAKISFAAVSVEQLRAAAFSDPFDQKSLRRHVETFTASQRKKIKQKIRSGYLSGLDTNQIASSLSTISRASQRESIALARTSLQHIATSSKQAFYAENADIVKAVRYVSTLDSRTTAICRSRDNKVFTQKEAPEIPAHWQCRSFYVPVLDENLVDGSVVGERSATKARAGGSEGSDEVGTVVKADLSHDDYLRRQPNWWLDDVMGPTRSKLFRKGGLGVDDFVNDVKKDTRQLTLKELKKLHPGAFEKAGLTQKK